MECIHNGILLSCKEWWIHVLHLTLDRAWRNYVEWDKSESEGWIWDNLTHGHKLKNKSRKRKHKAELGLLFGVLYQSKELWGRGCKFQWEYKLLQPLGRAVWRTLRRLGMGLPYDPVTPLLGLQPKEPNLPTQVLGVYQVVVYIGEEWPRLGWKCFVESSMGGTWRNHVCEEGQILVNLTHRRNLKNKEQYSYFRTVVYPNRCRDSDSGKCSERVISKGKWKKTQCSMWRRIIDGWMEKHVDTYFREMWDWAPKTIKIL